jgi:hypothetical protein
MPDRPIQKPKNYSKILDILNTPGAAEILSPKTYVNLVGEYSRKAYDNVNFLKKNIWILLNLYLAMPESWQLRI